MELEQLKYVLKILHPLAGLRITFKSGGDGVTGLMRLAAYVGKYVRVDQQDACIIPIVTQSREWCNNANRTIRVSFPVIDKRDEIALAIYKDVERVAPRSDTPLSRLISGRVKTRSQAATQLLKEIGPDNNLKKQMAEWGLEIRAEFVEQESFPQLQFTLNEGNRILAELRLDAATGQIIQEGRETQFCSTIESARERVRELFTGFLKTI